MTPFFLQNFEASPSSPLTTLMAGCPKFPPRNGHWCRVRRQSRRVFRRYNLCDWLQECSTPLAQAMPNQWFSAFVRFFLWKISNFEIRHLIPRIAESFSQTTNFQGSRLQTTGREGRVCMPPAWEEQVCVDLWWTLDWSPKIYLRPSTLEFPIERADWG